MNSSSFIILFVTILFLIKLIDIIRKSNSENRNTKLPPGPWKLPLIGNMLSMVSQKTPSFVLRSLAQVYGPLMHLQLGEVSALVISSPRIAKEIMVKNDVAFADRPQILTAKVIMYDSSDIAFTNYGSYWRQLRKICTLELLTNKKVQSFSCIREEEVKFLVESIRASSQVNLTKMVTHLINTVTSKAAFGPVPKDQEQLVQGIQDMVDLGGGFSLADLFPSYGFLKVVTGMSYKVGKIHRKLDKILDKILGEHEKELKSRKGTKASDNENFLDILYRMKDSDDLETPITIDNIKAVVLDIFSAGTDTAASTVEWAMAELLRNPEVLREAQAEVRQVLKVKDLVHEGDYSELKYLKLVIKESLRLHPIFPLLLPRECRESCEIDGYVIPVKTKVIVNAWALGRDPEYWKDAESFLPERFENSDMDYSGNSLEYLPFGAGRRRCPGSMFALANIEIILSHLLYHFNWEIAQGVKPRHLDMTETIGALARRKSNLHLIATPYTPL
uniref:premnaspirodiene oxygenase-like n=1 Tax=Erigeron canadensis TaxID=72917 RepID=UPI001CB90785|nr:premnaspirodiene oxygenase-like [Erigeron canadensis]